MGGYDTEGGDSDSDNVGSGYEQKCSICKKRFRSESAWSRHAAKRDSGCKGHKICFAWDVNLDHARAEYHSRCFVSDCSSEYASGSWSDTEIVKHVKEEHTDWGSDSSSD